MHKIELHVSTREKTGKAATSLYEGGKARGVFYGKTVDNQPVVADAREVEKIYHEAGMNQVVELKVDDGKMIPVMFKEVQYDPVRGELRHFDLYAVDMAQAIESEVPVHLSGEAPAEQTGGILFQVIEEVTVEAKPADIPEEFTVDVSGLAEIGDSIDVSVLEIPEGVELITDPEEVLVKIEAPKEEEEPEPIEDLEGVEGEEGEAAEGEEGEAEESAEEAEAEGEKEE